MAFEDRKDQEIKVNRRPYYLYQGLGTVWCVKLGMRICMAYHSQRKVRFSGGSLARVHGLPP